MVQLNNCTENKHACVNDMHACNYYYMHAAYSGTLSCMHGYKLYNFYYITLYIMTKIANNHFESYLFFS